MMSDCAAVRTEGGSGGSMSVCYFSLATPG